METGKLLDALKKDHLDNVLDQVADYDFAGYLGQLIEERQVKKSELFNAAAIERSYGYQILKGRRLPSRDKVLALALSLQLSLEETGRLLSLSDNGALYANVKRDAVIIYCLARHMSVMDTNLLLAQHGYDSLDEV
ncbi:Putative uncharacterized protein [Lactobacillus equicursoris DSM 19284 = JCM 14600 = CIP 110162]|nr:hypothetical protein [Lactobacillus equicursoris]MDD6407264.1 hypothetical protein [Lactobacillus equicursoris]CCK84793.1 Putative uncharacterized protein [Lactobacillus equicursoris DSM 19284 = JCM 14600 = CIP 110162]